MRAEAGMPEQLADFVFEFGVENVFQLAACCLERRRAYVQHVRH
jgi:hypothetical protein